MKHHKRYHVDYIVRSYKPRKGQGNRYLVAWKGYGPVENTIEPYHLLKGTTALKEFREQQEMKKIERIAKMNRDGVFAVKSIMDHRLVRRKHEFLVHWEGYPSEEATWEPYGTVRDLKALDRWERKHGRLHI